MVNETWRHLSLGEVITLKRGYDLPQKERRPGTVPIISSSGRTDTHNESRAVGPGVVTGRYGTIGEVFFVPEDFWPLNTTLFVKDFKGNDPLFISFMLRTIDYNPYSGKSGVPGVNRNDLHEIGVNLPPLPEQQAIAAVLSDVDALIASLDELIAKKNDIKRATMQLLLTGKKRLPKFSDTWKSASIEQLEKSGILELSRGKVISIKDIENHPGDYPIYSSSVKNTGLFGRYGDYMFDNELITWSVDGGGNFFYRHKHRFSVTNVAGVMRVDTSRINYRFLAAELELLHSRMAFDYQIKAHPSVIRKLYTLLLPSLDEQKAIATILSDMDAEIATLEQSRDKTRALKQGMMQELLTGKTRLI